MVDPIGAKPASIGDRGVAPVTRIAVARPAAAPASEGDTASASALRSVARELASAAPIDHERVAEIRAAIASDTYPIVSETIADRLIALKLDWHPDDPS